MEIWLVDVPCWFAKINNLRRPQKGLRGGREGGPTGHSHVDSHPIWRFRGV